MALPNFKESFKRVGAVSVVALMATMPLAAANAEGAQRVGYQQSPIAADYVTNCRSGNCAKTMGALWSDKKENVHGIAISVRMGTNSALPDTDIKQIATSVLQDNGVRNTPAQERVKFFFEENDAQHTMLFLHARGGTKGPFFLDDNLVVGLKEHAGYANNLDNALAYNPN